jgi:Domain of unknown function (DUF4386)
MPGAGSVARYAGAAFVAQFVTSLAAGLLSASALSGDVGTVLAADPTRLRAAVLLELLTGVGIIALASLLHVALRDTVRWVATVACALWVAEATVLAASTLGLSALLDLRGGGGSAATSDAAVARFAIGLHEHAATVGLLFFGAGALLWYALFVRTRFVPRWLGVWGVASVVPVGLGTLLSVWDSGAQPSILLYVAYVPFELVVGIWLLVTGSPEGEDHRPSPMGPSAVVHARGERHRRARPQQ